jgi:hypothetical protein
MIEWALLPAFDPLEMDWNDVGCVVVNATPDLAKATACATGAL